MSGQRNYLAQGTIPPYRVVKFGSADKTVVIATAATDLLIGVTGRYKGSVVAGDRVDVIRDDLAEVEFGDTVTRGQALTSDASGRAIPATPAALKQTVIESGVASSRTVTGIATTDTLVSVLWLTEGYVDETANFTISAENTISNVDGNINGGWLIVTYRKAPVRVIGYAEVSGVVGDIGWVMIEPSSC